MLLKEVNTPFERKAILHYGSTGNKVVKHYFEMQHVFGTLYKGREEDENEYTGGHEVICNLYVVFPETDTGFIVEKNIRIYRKEDEGEVSDEIRKYTADYNSYLDSMWNTENMEKNLVKSGFDSLDHYLDRMRRLMAEQKWVGLLEVAFTRQVDQALADELAEWRLAYKAHREALQKERHEKEEAEAAAWIAERNTEAQESVDRAVDILKNGGTLHDDSITFYHSKYDKEYWSIVQYLLHKYEIEVPLRTLGWIKNSLTSVEIENGRAVSCGYSRTRKTQRGSQAVFQYLNKLIEAVRKDG